jgi:hypothetical protein
MAWVLTYYVMRRRAEKSGCAFKKACINYDNMGTKMAMERVVKLLIKNMESDKVTEMEYTSGS